MEQKQNLRSRVGRLILAAGIASAMTMPAMAFAGEVEDEPGTHVTAAAYRAAAPSVEILGADGVEETNTFIDSTNWYTWAAPKYYIFADTTNNTHPSCYLYNLAQSRLGNIAYDASNTAVLHNARTGTGAGPNQALGTTGDDATIRGLADVRVGNGLSGGAVADPDAIYYNASSFETLSTTMGLMAGAIDDVSGKSPRYGSAQAIANLYDRYIFGTKGYVAQAISDEVLAPKTVALVWAVDGNDEDGYSYTLLSNTASGAGDGTASSNRYLETVSGIAYNYADEVSDYIDVADVQDEFATVDLILVGGQSSASSYGAIMHALDLDGLLGKTYWTYNNGTAGSNYGVVMNSVENAQNIGRILGCLYGDDVVVDDEVVFEGIDQDDWIAYYYDNFYHIEESQLGNVMANAMTGSSSTGGVRNWDAVGSTTVELSRWTAADASTYDETAVQSIIDDGYSFYLNNGYYVVG